MVKSKGLTLKAKIIRRLQKGVKPKQIAEALGCKPSQVYTAKYEWKNSGKTDKPEKIFTEPKIGDNVGGLVLTDMGNGKVKWVRQPRATAVLEEVPEFLKKQDDPINPDHYKRNGVEVIDVIEAYDLNYRLGNVIKYVTRSGFKGNALEDLKKARWYLDREIAKHE